MNKQVKKNKIFNYAKRSAIYDFYMNYFYDMFLTLYEVKGFNYQQNNFLLRKMWGVGKIASFDTVNVDGVDAEVGLSVFTDNEKNYLDFPSTVYLENNRGVPFIPTESLQVDKDVVIGYARHNQKSVRDTVEFIVSKICDVEMCLRKNLEANSTPWLIACDVASEKTADAFIEKLESDDDVLVFKFKEGEKPYGLVSGAPYIIDKLYNQKNAYINEILTFFGVNNLGTSEKKEHLITSEIDVNNEFISLSGDNFGENLQGFIERTNKVFNTKYKVIKKFNAVNVNANVDESDYSGEPKPKTKTETPEAKNE